MSYRAFALLPPKVDLSLAGLVDRVASRFRQVAGNPAHLVVQDDSLVLLVDRWSLHLAMASGPHVQAESREIAKMFAKKRADEGSIAACEHRIEIWSDPDPDMVYFNRYVGVLETLEEVPGVILFDPEAGTFI